MSAVATHDQDPARLATASRPPIDFEALFERLPSPYMVLDRELRFVEVNAAYRSVTERSRDELIGHCLFDLFPNSGPEEVRLRRSIERVLETGESDTLALLAYPITRPTNRGGESEMRYWCVAHVPLFDSEGRAAYLLQNAVEVTELQRLKTIAYGRDAAVPLAGELLLRARQSEEANRALTEETQGLRELFQQAPGFMAVLAGPDLTFTLANAAYYQVVGHRQIIGKPLAVALPEIPGQGFDQLLRDVMASGEAYIGEAVSVMLERTQNAPVEERFLDFIYQPLTKPSGEAWGVFVQGSDVTDRVLAERQQKLLLEELNHRVKNTLATVQAIAAQTLRASPDPQAFRKAFEGRLLALSATHDLLTASNWRSASLPDLLRAEIRPYAPARFELSGPAVRLSPRQTVALGLVFHELITNAVKYGALSAGGEVEVHSSVYTDGPTERLRLEWVERDGPPVHPTGHRGFGSKLIETSLIGLGGSAKIELPPEGLRCTLDMRLTEDPQRPASPQPPPSAG